MVVLTSLLVVTHVVVPHHHHHDRIYLLLEESHEDHRDHADGENKCHHGEAVAEVLVCACGDTCGNGEISVVQHSAGFMDMTQRAIPGIMRMATPFVHKNTIPFQGPPLLSWGLRAPPAF